MIFNIAYTAVQNIGVLFCFWKKSYMLAKTAFMIKNTVKQ